MYLKVVISNLLLIKERQSLALPTYYLYYSGEMGGVLNASALLKSTLYELHTLETWAGNPWIRV